MLKSICTKLSVTINKLKPILTKCIDHQSKVKTKTDKMAKYIIIQKQKPVKPLTVGENVLFKLVVHGLKVKLFRLVRYPRSYTVKGEKSLSYRRTRRQET